MRTKASRLGARPGGLTAEPRRLEVRDVNPTLTAACADRDAEGTNIGLINSSPYTRARTSGFLETPYRRS